MSLQPKEIYASQVYQDLAQEIENLQTIIKTKIDKLKELFPPPKEKAWVIMGDLRPYMMTLVDDDHWLKEE